MHKTEERDFFVVENEGQKIFGVLHRPLTNALSPLVIFCHGLAGHKSGSFRSYVALAQRLAEAGITALRFDFRGSGDSEGEFSEVTTESEVSDLMKIFTFVLQDTRIDPNRIGLFGRSFGGLVAIRAAAQHMHVKSLALWAPMYDAEQWRGLWKGPQDLPFLINGQLPSKKLFDSFFAMKLTPEFEKISHIPLLHIHGDSDGVVSLLHADQYKQARSFAKAQNHFVILEKGDHDFSERKGREEAMKTTIDWFKQTL